jgi:hypothetical protein
MAICRLRYFSITIDHGLSRVSSSRPSVLRSFSLVITPLMRAGMNR